MRKRKQAAKAPLSKKAITAPYEGDPLKDPDAPMLAKLSVSRPIFVTSLVLLSVFLGWLSYSRLGVDLFPEIEIPVVTVVVPYRGAGPAEIETLVVKPIEEDLATLGGVKRVFAVAGDGFGSVTCQYYSDVDMKKAEQDVRNRVQNLRARLPKEVDEPHVQRISLSDIPVVELGLEADLPPAQLYDLAKEDLKPLIEQVTGVGKLDLIGGTRREIQVQLDRGQLKRRELAASAIVGRIAENSSNVPVGKVEKGNMDLSFRTLGEYRSLRQIEDAVVNFYAGDVPVRVRDVAKVEDTVVDPTSLAYLNGRTAILFHVFKQSGTNTVAVVDKVLQKVEKLNASMKGKPGNPKITLVRDSGLWIRQNVDDVKETITIGILLVIIVVFFFLGNFRSTFITGLALPNSLLGAFILMNVAGFTINIMTLLALSLSVGLLIDDAIVVRENIFRLIEKGVSPLKAALQGTKEVSLAVLATSATVIAVFLPVGFLSGTVGQFLSQFGLTMCFAMVISFLDALTIAPMLSAYFAGKGGHGAGMENPRSLKIMLGGGLIGMTAVGVVGIVLHHPIPFAIAGSIFGALAPRWVAPFQRLQERIEARYVDILRWVLLHRRRTLLIAAGIFFLSFVAASRVTFTFIPAADSTEYQVTLEMPEGTTLKRTAAVAREVEAVLLKRPEIAALATTVEGNKARLFAGLVVGSKRKLSAQDLKTITREQLKAFAYANPKVGDVDATGGAESPYTLVLKGENLEELDAYANQVVAGLRTGVKGLVEVDSTARTGKPEFQVKLDPLRAGRLGVSTVTAGLELRTLTDGAVAGKYRQGGREYDIRVRLKPEQRDLEANYDFTYVPNLNFNLIRLSGVSSSQKGSGPATINRRDRTRSVIITAQLAQGAGLGQVLDQSKLVLNKIKAPAGVEWDFIGQAEDFADMQKSMGTAILLALVIMFLVLASLYESFITPFTIMLAVPLAIAGAFYALFIVTWLGDVGFLAFLQRLHLFHVNRLDASINLFSMIGLVLLMGLVAKNSILLVDQTMQFIKAGMKRDEAIVEAGKHRLRPILMTSLALIFGTLPLALALSEAGRFRSSMGIGIVGGLISSTALTLLVVPAAFEYVDDFKNWFEKWVRKIGGRE